MRVIGCLVLSLLLWSAGCATYSERIELATSLTADGDYVAAIDELDSFLGVDSPDELPDDWGSERSLAVLERGVLHQALGNYEASARDLSASETELELLDFKYDTAGQIGKYVYSGSSQDYETAPTERLALNAVNMLNYLALGDWAGASVEARRYTIMREYLEAVDLPHQATFGSYLAGLSFEQLGEGDRALRYYEEAMENGTLVSLRATVARLAASHSYRGPRIREILGESNPSPAPAPSEIVTVVSLGRVPSKLPERLPIGAAVGIAGTYITGNPQILARSLFKVVVYPALADSGSRAQRAAVEIDGANARIERVSHLGADIRREHEMIKPRIIAAALTRMIARAAVAEGARYAGRQAKGDAGKIIGLLAALGTEAALVGLDKPDTRSWTMLADQVLISRQTVEPGEHLVRVDIGGHGLNDYREFEVDVPKGRAVVLVVTDPR